MTIETKNKIKEVLQSAGITFLTVFLLAVLPYVGDVTLDELKNGTFLALIISACRIGVKEAILVIIPFIKGLKK